MSQVEILRHAIDAARAGNPELARVHLQKAAEIVPDDPAVWLWLSWLSDSPVSMIQCLELVRRHDDYREIAESGLAFARGLARFNCDELLPKMPEAKETTASSCDVGSADATGNEAVQKERPQFAPSGEDIDDETSGSTSEPNASSSDVDRDSPETNSETGPENVESVTESGCDASVPEDGALETSGAEEPDVLISKVEEITPEEITPDEITSEGITSDEITSDENAVESSVEKETTDPEFSEPTTTHEPGQTEEHLGSVADAEVEAALLADMELSAAQAWDDPEAQATDSDEHHTADETTSLWDGIALLSRTADAVADELRADQSGQDETLELPRTDADDGATRGTDRIVTDGVATDGVVTDGVATDGVATDGVATDGEGSLQSPSDVCGGPSSAFGGGQSETGEGAAWFDYWRPSEESEPDHDSSTQTNRESCEIQSAGISDSSESTGIDSGKLPASENLKTEFPSQSDAPGESDDGAGDAATADRSTENSDSLEETNPTPLVPEIVDEESVEELRATEESSESEVTEASAHDGFTDAGNKNETGTMESAAGYVPPIAQTVFDIPENLQSDGTPRPQRPLDHETEASPEEPAATSDSEVRATPSSSHKPGEIWRAAQSDWFSVDGQEHDPGALVPHDQSSVNPLPASESPAAQGTPLTGEQSASTPSTPGQIAVRKADASMFDAEASAIIPGPAPSNRLDPSAEPGMTPATETPATETASTETGIGQVLDESFDDAAQQEPTPKMPQSQARIPSNDTRTVLVVDDSPTVRKLVEMSLERNGFRVVHAFDGVAAIKEIARQNPALILMDVSMPRLDGYQLCKLVKKHETTRHIPVVMLTSREGVFDKLRGRLVGCSGYIAKPFSPEELVASVEQFLSEPAPTI